MMGYRYSHSNESGCFGKQMAALRLTYGHRCQHACGTYPISAWNTSIAATDVTIDT